MLTPFEHSVVTAFLAASDLGSIGDILSGNTGGDVIVSTNQGDRTIKLRDKIVMTDPPDLIGYKLYRYLVANELIEADDDIVIVNVYNHWRSDPLITSWDNVVGDWEDLAHLREALKAFQ